MNLDDRLEKMRQELKEKMATAERETEEKMRRVQRQLEEKLGKLGSDGGRPETMEEAAQVPSASKEEANKKQASSVVQSSRLPQDARTLVHQEEFRSLFLPSSAEIQQAWAFVSRSPHIADNILYKRAQGANFLFAEDDATVNAFATDAPCEMPDGTVLEGPTVLFCAGLANALCLSATALALQHTAHGEGRLDGKGPASAMTTTFNAMGRAIIANKGQLPMDAVTDVFNQTVIPLLSDLRNRGEESYAHCAPSFRASLYMAVVAHEIGHIAYGHTLGRSSNYSVSRGQEFDADSFAAQTLSTCPYSEYHFLAQIIVAIVFAWMENAGKVTQASTHPLGVERFRQMFRDAHNRVEQEVVQQFGIARADLEELLPPA